MCYLVICDYYISCGQYFMEARNSPSIQKLFK